MVYQDDFIERGRSFEGGLEKASCNGIVSCIPLIFHGEKQIRDSIIRTLDLMNLLKRKLVPHIMGLGMVVY